MDMEEHELISLGHKQIAEGKLLCEKIDTMKNIQGIAKIRKKILSEISALQEAISTGKLTINHIMCSNLVHFGYLVKIIGETDDIQSIDYPIKLRGDHKSSIRVDIVANGGSTWIKVIARNPKALNDIAFGRTNYGKKSILDHAECYIEAAENNPHCFKSPTVIFDFAHQINEALRDSLTEMNVCVRICGKAKSHNTNSDENNDSYMNINVLNLDVTTMMAFISNLTCDSCHWTFDNKILNDQARREQNQSTKKILDDLFQGKELIACETAIQSFLSILSTVGGENEKNRGMQLLDQIKILPDLSETEENSLWMGNNIRLGKKITMRTYKIFTFGMYHKAVTVTANKGAIEAAKMQGILIPAFVHEARALTEQKQTPT